jgi:hypothetical protein
VDSQSERSERADPSRRAIVTPESRALTGSHAGTAAVDSQSERSERADPSRRSGYCFTKVPDPGMGIA